MKIDWPPFLRGVSQKRVIPYAGQWEEDAHKANSALFQSNEGALTPLESEIAIAAEQIAIIARLKSKPEALRKYLASIQK
jgi:hypothetical protein